MHMSCTVEHVIIKTFCRKMSTGPRYFSRLTSSRPIPVMRWVNWIKPKSLICGSLMLEDFLSFFLSLGEKQQSLWFMLPIFAETPLRQTLLIYSICAWAESAAEIVRSHSLYMLAVTRQLNLPKYNESELKWCYTMLWSVGTTWHRLT